MSNSKLVTFLNNTKEPLTTEKNQPCVHWETKMADIGRTQFFFFFFFFFQCRTGVVSDCLSSAGLGMPGTHSCCPQDYVQLKTSLWHSLRPGDSRTRGQHRFFQERSNYDTLRNSFFQRTVRAWNHLPYISVGASSIEKFRANLQQQVSHANQ
jgi:hypothetical protein